MLPLFLSRALLDEVHCSAKVVDRYSTTAGAHRQCSGELLLVDLPLLHVVVGLLLLWSWKELHPAHSNYSCCTDDEDISSQDLWQFLSLLTIQSRPKMQIPLGRINQFHSKLILILNSGGGSGGADSSGGWWWDRYRYGSEETWGIWESESRTEVVYGFLSSQLPSGLHGGIIMSPEASEPVFIVQLAICSFWDSGKIERPLHSCNRIAVLYL